MNLVGREMTVDEVLHEVAQDAGFYARSGGGLTLSGGEPLAQPGFAGGPAGRYKVEDVGLHTVVETCGHAAWEDAGAARAVHATCSCSTSSTWTAPSTGG